MNNITQAVFKKVFEIYFLFSIYKYKYTEHIKTL